MDSNRPSTIQLRAPPGTPPPIFVRNPHDSCAVATYMKMGIHHRGTLAALRVGVHVLPTPLILPLGIFDLHRPGIPIDPMADILD